MPLRGSSEIVGCPAYGVRKYQRSDTQLELCVEEILACGYTVLFDVLSNDEPGLARDRIDAIYELQRRELGDDALAKIGDTDTVRCLLSYDDFFVELAANSAVCSLVSLTSWMNHSFS